MRIRIPLPRKGGPAPKLGFNPLTGIYLCKGEDFPHEGFSLGKVRVFYRGTTSDGLVRYEVVSTAGKVTPEDIANVTEFLLALAQPGAEVYREISDWPIILAGVAILAIIILAIRGLRR